MPDTKPAREPLLPCPLCAGPGHIDFDPGDWGYRDAKCWVVCIKCGARGPVVEGDSNGVTDEMNTAAIAAWNRRITRSPAPDEVAEAVKWARGLADQEEADDTGRIFTDLAIRNLRILAAAAERAPTEAQVREIAEAWQWMIDSDIHSADLIDMARALQPILGGDHD